MIYLVGLVVVCLIICITILFDISCDIHRIRKILDGYDERRVKKALNEYIETGKISEEV